MAKNSDTSRDVWAEIAAPLNPKQIKTRQQPTRGGKSIDIRYIDARDVIHRLNSVVPGQWEFTWEVAYIDNAGGWNVKGKLSILGVVHEDVGDAAADCWGGPAKAAVSDALKRCAVHFGFGIELYGEVPDEAPQQQAARPAKRPMSPETLREFVASQLQGVASELCTQDQARKLAIKWRNILQQDDQTRHAVASYIVSASVDSFKSLTGAEVDVLDRWLTSNAPAARQEAQTIIDLISSQFAPGA